MKTRLYSPVALCILAAAIALSLYGASISIKPKFQGNLKDILPPAPADWSSIERPIADSPEIKKAVGEILNYDDGVLIEYTGPQSSRISVYLAYWKPGKMSHRLIAGHTPDVCWTQSGWRKVKEARLESFQVQSQSPSHLKANVTIPHGEDRIFETESAREFVWFWHLVGNESRSYGTGYSPPWHAAITDIFRKGLNQREEQFFIRISSRQPLETQLQGSPLPTILASLPWPKESVKDPD